jgi:hypothetical protein
MSRIKPAVSCLLFPRTPKRNDVFAPAVIRILCEANGSLGTAVVNGLLAWAGVLSGLTVFFSGLPAAVALVIPSRPESLSRRINQGLGFGFLVGTGLGSLVFVAFVARVIP